MTDADTIATLRAQLDSTLKDRALIIAERDDARLAVALVVEKAAGVVSATCDDILSKQDGKNDAVDRNLRLVAVMLPDLADAILALADTDALAEAQKLRDELARVTADRDLARQLFMQACEPLAASPEIQDVVLAVEEWVNKRGGEETADQIAIMAIQAYQRATLKAGEAGLVAWLEAQVERLLEAQADQDQKLKDADARADAAVTVKPVGLFTTLTDEQQRQALAFRGNPDFGPVEAAGAKVTRLVEAMERIKSRALWVRGNQSYREFPKYVLNAVRDALADIKGDKP